MRFSAVIALALSAVAVSAKYHNGTETTITEIVTQYTTYCPLPTQIIEGNKTYIVTEPTILTISNCPCTRTKTYTTVTSSVCPGGCSHKTGTGMTYPTVTSPPSYTNGTTAMPTVYPTPAYPSNPSNTTSKVPPSATPSSPTFEGSANRVTVAAGALAGLIGVAAYLL